MIYNLIQGLTSSLFSKDRVLTSEADGDGSRGSRESKVWKLYIDKRFQKCF